jgi:hypothetical protein
VGLASKADALPAAGAWAGNGNQINDVGVPFHTADAKQLNQAQPKNNSNDNSGAQVLLVPFPLRISVW